MKHLTGSRESIVLGRRHALLEATRPYVERYHDEIFIGCPDTTLTRGQMMPTCRRSSQRRKLKRPQQPLAVSNLQNHPRLLLQSQ